MNRNIWTYPLDSSITPRKQFDRARYGCAIERFQKRYCVSELEVATVIAFIIGAVGLVLWGQP